MKKVILLVLALLLVVVPSFAQEEMHDYDSVDAATLNGVTVTFWHQHTRFRETQLEAMVAVFNNPDVAVADFIAEQGIAPSEEELATLTTLIEALREVAREYNPYGIIVDASNQGGYGEIFDKMTAGIVAGGADLPSLVVAYQNQAATYQLDNALIDINPLVESEIWGMSEEDYADFFPGFVNSDIFSTYGGARLGFPPNRSMEMLYYNIDWLAELRAAGAISFDGPPVTPEQFTEAACAAVENPFSNAATDAAPMGYQLSIDASRFASWAFAFGGDMFDYENNQYDLANDGAVAAMEYIQGLFADGCAIVVTENFGDQTSFGAGGTLFTVGSSSGLPFYQGAVSGAYESTDTPEGFQWSVTALPHTTEEPVMNVYGASVSIPHTTTEQELGAWIFTKFYTDARVQAYWAVASNYFPVRASSAAELEDYFAGFPAYKAAFDLLQYGYAEPPVAGYDFVRNMIGEAMGAIVSDVDADVVEILEETNESANQNLADLTGE